MSYSLTVYAVPMPKLLAVSGSRDVELIEQAQACSFVADQIDEMIARHNEDSDEEGQITISFADAAAQLVNGEVPPDAPHFAGFVYGYAFEWICAALGQCLDNDHVPGLHFEKVDEFLEKGRVGLRLLDLTCAGTPLDFPEPDDWPSIGWWSPEQIAKAVRPLAELPLDGAKVSIARCVEQIRAWVAEALEIEDAGLIGFVY
jgi:hypothetical protein